MFFKQFVLIKNLNTKLNCLYYDFKWKNSPKEAGYNVHTFTFNPTDISHADSAVSLKECGASLNVILGDTNPFIINEPEEDQYDENDDPIPIEAYENENDNSKKDKYVIHVRTLVLRKLEVFWCDKSGRLKYMFV